jgi:hypothetical protein
MLGTVSACTLWPQAANVTAASGEMSVFGFRRSQTQASAERFVTAESTAIVNAS